MKQATVAIVFLKFLGKIHFPVQYTHDVTLNKNKLNGKVASIVVTDLAAIAVECKVAGQYRVGNGPGFSGRVRVRAGFGFKF